MQLSIKFATLYASVLMALAPKVIASPALVGAEGNIAAEVARADADAASSPIMSVEQLKHWLATTDAELTFVGEPINPLTSRAVLATTVTFCSTRFQNVCSGPCTVFTGSGVCIGAPNTNCLAATGNVVFCAGDNCGGGCNQLASCGTRLDNGFCFTPGTNSISIPA